MPFTGSRLDNEFSIAMNIRQLNEYGGLCLTCLRGSYGTFAEMALLAIAELRIGKGLKHCSAGVMFLSRFASCNQARLVSSSSYDVSSSLNLSRRMLA